MGALFGVPAWAVAALVLAFFIGVVYLPAARAPFIFDDSIAVIQNDSIVSLWPLIGFEKPGPLNPPPEHPTSGRPLVNLSFAVNYHFGGLNPVGYHLVNLALHFLNAMLVWSLTRRTLRLPYFGDRFARSAQWLALAVASVWSLHPLQTEAVVYATQRTELMMAFFYLATIYCSLRYWEFRPFSPAKFGAEGASNDTRLNNSNRNFWLVLAVIACLCGMASKEVMVSAPLIVLLFERTFISGSLTNSLRRSWPLYLGLASTWLLLAALTVAAPRADSAGFNLGIPPHVWWFTQSQILFLYLKLVFWPWPLLIHYKLPYIADFADAWCFVVPLVLIGAVTLGFLWRNSPLGFLGTWFFAILSPTFAIPVVTEMAAERRMYLALATLSVLFIIGIYRLAGALNSRTEVGRQPSGVSAQLLATGVLAISLTLVFCFLSTTRLAAYDNETTLWLEVLQTQPENPRAHLYLGTLLESQGNAGAAIKEYREAIRLQPNPVQAHYRLGLLLNKEGTYSDAAAEFAKAIRGLPTKSPAMHNDMAVALYMAGRNDQAIEAFRETLAIDPSFGPAYRNLGTALQKAAKFQEAVESFETALRLNPHAIDIYNDLANSYFHLSQRTQAIAALEHGLELAKAAGDTENIKKFTAALQAKR